MPLTHLAACPTAPTVLLGHLVEHALATRVPNEAGRIVNRANDDLRCALAGNPAVPDPDVHRLVDGVALTHGRADILRAALMRPDLSAVDAIAILGDDRSAGALNQALDVVADPDGTLAAHAFTHGRGTSLWDRLLTQQSTPTDIRWQAALLLATCDKKLSTKHVTHITAAVRDRLTWTRTPAEHTLALAWVEQMATATPSGSPLAERLHKQAKRRFAPTQPGKRAWLTNPHTPLEDVIAWATEHGPEAWRDALTGRRDPHGQLAVAAQRAAGDEPRVASALVARHRPPQVRQRAALALERAGTPVNSHEWSLLLSVGDPTLAVHLFTKDAPRWAADKITRRTDLTSDHLDTLMAADHLHLGMSRLQFAMWLGTYPSANRRQRLSAQQVVREATTSDWRRLPTYENTLIAALGPRMGQIDPADPDSLVAVAGHLNLATRPDAFAPYPGAQWLLRSALAALMPATFDASAARVLTPLAGSFSGTLGELFETAQVISS